MPREADERRLQELVRRITELEEYLKSLTDQGRKEFGDRLRSPSALKQIGKIRDKKIRDMSLFALALAESVNATPSKKV